LFRSLTVKLVSTYLVVILVALLLVGSAVNRLVVEYFVGSAERSLLQQAKAAITLFNRTRSQQKADRPASRPPLTEVEALDDGFLAVVAGVLTGSDVLLLDQQGRIVHDSRDRRGAKPPSDQGKQLVPPKALAGLKEGDPPRLLRRADVLGKPAAAVIAKPRTNPGDPDLYLFMRRPFANVQESARGVFGVLLRSGLIAAVITVAISLGLARGLTRPIRRLTDAARRMAAGDLEARTGIRGRDELARLGKSFDDMGERVSSLVAVINADRERFQAILRSMEDGLVSVDPGGKVLFMNPRFGQLMGMDPGAAAEGAGFRGLLAEEPRMTDLIAQALERCQPYAAEVETAHGERVLVVTVTPYGTGGGETGASGLAQAILIVVRDVTELRRLERTRLDFISSVSHELRTPITSIQGFAEALLEGVAVGEDEQRKYAAIIAGEAGRLRRLIDDLFQFARMETGRMDFHFEPVGLGEVVRGVVATMMPQAEATRITLSARVSDPLSPALGDRDRLSQVLLNLVANAVRFTPSGGEISVTATAEGKKLVVRVADTGSGIPAEDLPKVFDRYFKSRHAAGARAGGTGLGLAIAKHIVEAHGGRITVASEEGKGSVFTVTLDAIPAS
jgi:PAS domain S-box-containing protein